MADTFEVTYGNDDGYAGGDRPHSFDIDAGDLYGGMTEESLKELFRCEIEWAKRADQPCRNEPKRARR